MAVEVGLLWFSASKAHFPVHGLVSGVLRHRRAVHGTMVAPALPYTMQTSGFPRQGNMRLGSMRQARSTKPLLRKVVVAVGTGTVVY